MELVYEDEILPEIEIRELLTLEQVLDNNPSFVAFTRAEVLKYLNDLFPQQVATSLTSDIFAIVERPLVAPLSKNIVPVLRADKLEHVMDEIEYEKSLEDMKNAPNYNAQQYLLHKLTYPLDHNPPSQENEAAFVAKERPTLVAYSSDPKKTTVLLPKDNLPESFIGGIYVAPNTTSESYISERVVASQPIVSDNVIHTNDLRSIIIPFESVLSELTSVPDIHVLRHALKRFNYDLENLTTPQLTALIQHIKSLPFEDNDNDNDQSRKSPTTRVFKVIGRDFYDALNDGLNVHALDKEKYNAIYNAITTSIPPPQLTNIAEIPYDIGDILEGIRSNKFTIQEVATFLKIARNRVIIDDAFATIQRYMELDPEAIPESIQHIIEKWSHRNLHYNDRTARVFLEMYKDVAEIKQGTDTSTYDGNPTEQPFQVFEEMQYEYVDQTVNEEDDIPIDEEAALPSFNAPEGVKEALVPVLQKMQHLSKASGVPISLEQLISYITPRIVRISFQETLQQNVPQLAPELRLQIATSSYDSAMRIAMGIVPLSLSDDTQQVIRAMFKEYTRLLKQLFIESVAWYVLQTQLAFLENRLEFDPITNGMMACIRQWSPLGAPLTKEKEHVGVLYYLATVAQESAIIETPSEELVKSVLSFISDTQSDVIGGLQEKYADVLANQETTISKAQQANVSLNEAIQLKLKRRIIPDFVRAFLYLPGSVKHTFQQLGSQFRADTDWQDLKKLRAVKDQLAKKRMTKAERPPLAWLETRPQSEPKEKQNLFVPTEIVEERNNKSQFTEWLETCKADNLFLLPPDIIDTVMTSPTALTAIITKHINAVTKTVNKKVTSSYFPRNAADATMKHLDIVAKSIHQYIHIYEGTEKAMITSSLQYIRDFKEKWSTLPPIRDMVDQSFVDIIIRYVVTRAACLPCDSRDVNSRTGKLDISDRVNANFVATILTSSFNAISSSFTNGQMPTSEEQHAFITKMREIQKVQTLNVLNAQSEEERQIMIDAKKIGLYKPTIDYTVQQNTEEGEAEFAYAGEDPDLPDDFL